MTYKQIKDVTRGFAQINQLSQDHRRHGGRGQNPFIEFLQTSCHKLRKRL